MTVLASLRAVLADAVAIAVVGFVAGCSSSSTAPGPDDPRELEAAPTTTSVGGRTLSLEAYLWRDFQPISPPNGKPLVAIARIAAAGGAQVPSTVRVDAMWVVNGTQVWASVPREEQARSETAPILEVVARDGPKWDPGRTVDVIVRVRDGAGEGHLLRAANQRINRTD